MCIQKHSILVTFSASQWTARKLDKKITSEVNTSHNAKEDAGRYNKLLVSKDKTEAISKIINAARTFHYTNTLSWSDNNERLLTTKLYFDYIQKMTEYKNNFEQEVNSFFAEYDNIIQAERIRLNGMFKIEDYPNKQELERKFNFGFTFMPVPENDLRLQLQDGEIEKIRQQVEEQIKERTLTAVKDVWNRIKDVLTTLRDKLADTEAVYRDSLFGNVADLLKLLPMLNVTDSTEISAITNEMQKIRIEPQVCRDNKAIRKNTVNQVDNILSMFSNNF